MIFVDTSFWAALVNSADPRHDAASALLATYERERLLTTNDVRGETWTFLRRRAGHHVGLRFLEAVDASTRLELVRISEGVEGEALAWLRRHDEREYSWVDATSFATMRQRRLDRAFAFDGDFSAAGFTELRN